jgi:hypothetical protein
MSEHMFANCREILISLKDAYFERGPLALRASSRDNAT